MQPFYDLSCIKLRTHYCIRSKRNDSGTRGSWNAVETMEEYKCSSFEPGARDTRKSNFFNFTASQVPREKDTVVLPQRMWHTSQRSNKNLVFAKTNQIALFYCDILTFRLLFRVLTNGLSSIENQNLKKIWLKSQYRNICYRFFSMDATYVKSINLDPG